MFGSQLRIAEPMILQNPTRPAPTFETILADPEFYVEDYIRDLDEVPQFRGDARLLGAVPACLKPALTLTANKPKPVDPTPVKTASDSAPKVSERTTRLRTRRLGLLS